MALTAEQLAEAKAMIDAAAHGNGGGGAPAGGWGIAPAASFAPPAATATGPQAVMIPIKLPTPDGGTIRIYLAFPGEAAANQQSLMALLGQLSQVMPLDVWVPKNSWGGRGGNGGGYGGNGNGGGGWGRNRGW